MFDFFDEGVIIYEQIRNVELENHGQDVLNKVDADIASGKIEKYTDQKLKDQAVYKIFQNNFNENRELYGTGDLGEVYAISLAQTLGAYSLVTDDTKQGGPYMSLLQFEDDIMPFTFADVLILRYLVGTVDEYQTVKDFNAINDASNLNWAFQSQLTKFIRRFFKDPYSRAVIVRPQENSFTSSPLSQTAYPEPPGPLRALPHRQDRDRADRSEKHHNDPGQCKQVQTPDSRRRLSPGGFQRYVP